MFTGSKQTRSCAISDHQENAEPRRTTSCIQMSETLSNVCFCVTSYTAHKHVDIGQVWVQAAADGQLRGVPDVARYQSKMKQRLTLAFCDSRFGYGSG